MTSYRLKIIAVVTMTIDHIGKILGQQFLLRFFPDALVPTFWMVHSFEWAGRLAFPLFAFMIAEGCAKTRSMPKYIARLVSFAIISQPFYRLAFRFTTDLHRFGTVKQAILAAAKSTLKPDNIFVVLSLGALAVWAYAKLKKSTNKRAIWLTVPALGGTAFAASYLRTGYEAFGVVLIFALYILPNARWKSIALVIWAIGMYALYASWNGVVLQWLPSHSDTLWGKAGEVITGLMPCISAACSALPVLAYNGKRGKEAKWIFYIYYPAHLLGLFVISLLMA
jgi:hypothetical protein